MMWGKENNSNNNKILMKVFRVKPSKSPIYWLIQSTFYISI